MMGDRRRRLTARCAPLVLAALCVTLVACEPPHSSAPAQESVALRPFEVLDSEVQRNGQVVVNFSSEIDPSSVGRRSVTISHRGENLRLRMKVEGSSLRIAPLLPRRRARRGAFVLRVEGSPSPRALRSTAGIGLTHRAEWKLDLARKGRPDHSPPTFVGSQPANGAVDVAPGQDIVLRFSEPLDRSAVRHQRRFRLLVNGADVSTTQRLIEGRTAVALRPAHPLQPNARIEIRSEGSVLDLAGNALEEAVVVRFDTWATELREITEEFQTNEMSDVRATNCSWCDVNSPGFLVWASGRRVVGPLVTDSGRMALSERRRVRFQMLLSSSDEIDGGSFASALRLVFLESDVPGGVLEATVDAGICDLDQPGPAFESNREVSDLLPLASVTRDAPLDIQRGDDGYGAVEIPFLVPLPIPAGANVLVDVTLTFAPGVRLLAVNDEDRSALLDAGTGLRLRPVAQLLVSGGTPQARSLWYDSGVARPNWRRQSYLGSLDVEGVRAHLEFQAAPALPNGLPDVELASSWENDLAALPRLRFVRFRTRFEGFPLQGEFPRIDRIVMPFESR